MITAMPRIAERGEGMFALVFQSDDLADAVAVHGARVRIEDRPGALTP